MCSQLEQTCRDAVWDERLPHFEAAWKWKRTDQWLRTLADPTPMEQNFLKLRNVRKSISDLLEKLAAELAWGHCFGRLTETERQHLTAWEKAMQRFGKGTGIHSSQHVREAQNHMVHCRSAIPAWIMPLYRVVETLRPNHDRFDVVIIDEASQSGPDALFLFEIGKKIIVVGDDKQIAPDPIGVRREEVEKLRSTYLRGIPCSDAIGVDNSLFDFAEIRFGGRIRLREHFRCMPEIIEFSNRLCYGTEPLIPLREYGSERLEPSVKSIYLPHSEQKGSSSLAVNLSEAKAIVKEIGCCLKDKRYDGKSFGVISLLGGTQAKLIWKKLINEISAEELEARQLTCGDAYAFQGDERDVMFLSMVSAPNDGHRIGTLADAKSERRFNVAVSRARDQVLLFHSVTEEDLHPSCLRLKLLSYFKNPQIPQVLEESLNSAEIKQLASGPRKKLRPPVPFNSWLEVDVFLAIHEKGYRVYPQFNVARYRIDLIIQGGKKGRLAVECDADREETDKQQDEDVARQRDLETCGWTFWRISPSWFYRNPKAALEPLWRKLEDLDIQAEISSSQLQRKAA